MEEYPHSELTRAIIGAAIDVQTELRPGLDEKLYERALCIALGERGLRFVQQPEYPVHFHDHLLGKLRPDLIVEDKIIVDAKCVECFTPAHDAQMLGYLNITGLQIGLLLNFKVLPLGKRRVIRSQPTPPPVCAL